MTEKEYAELLNLRQRCKEQREEIKRLYAHVKALKEERLGSCAGCLYAGPSLEQTMLAGNIRCNRFKCFKDRAGYCDKYKPKETGGNTDAAN